MGGDNGRRAATANFASIVVTAGAATAEHADVVSTELWTYLHQICSRKFER